MFFHTPFDPHESCELSEDRKIAIVNCNTVAANKRNTGEKKAEPVWFILLLFLVVLWLFLSSAENIKDYRVRPINPWWQHISSLSQTCQINCDSCVSCWSEERHYIQLEASNHVPIDLSSHCSHSLHCRHVSIILRDKKLNAEMGQNVCFSIHGGQRLQR